MSLMLGILSAHGNVHKAHNLIHQFISCSPQTLCMDYASLE